MKTSLIMVTVLVLALPALAADKKDKNYQSLVDNSPFLTPAFKARLGKRDNVSLLFMGYTRINGEWHFSVVEKKSGQSQWMKIDVEYNGLKIERFDEKAQSIHVTVGGLGVDLKLVKE